MDDIGPFTFNAVRFFVGFLAVAPLAFIFERKNILKSVQRNQKEFTNLAFLIGLSLFLGSALQQVALLYTDVANAAFFTIFYVPMVPFIIFFMYKKPTKNLTALKVKGPMSSIPVSWAIKVVPHINVQSNAQNNDDVFDIKIYTANL